MTTPTPTSELETLTRTAEALREMKSWLAADLKAGRGKVGTAWYADRLKALDAATAKISDLDGRIDDLTYIDLT